jgi:hypothetical protein
VIRFFSLAVGLACVASCGTGPGWWVPAPEQVRQIEMGMTVAQVEAILGPGVAVGGPPEETDPQWDISQEKPPGFRKGMGKGFAAPPNASWMFWGDDIHYVCLGFIDGRLRSTRLKGYDAPQKSGLIRERVSIPKGGRIDENTKVPRNPELEALQDKLRRDSGYAGEMITLSIDLEDCAENSPTLTPPNLEALERCASWAFAELKPMIQSGEIVVLWNAKRGSKIIAYPKMALEIEARYIDGQFRTQSGTPAQVKKLLSERK